MTISVREIIPCPDCGRYDIGQAHFCKRDEWQPISQWGETHLALNQENLCGRRTFYNRQHWAQAVPGDAVTCQDCSRALGIDPHATQVCAYCWAPIPTYSKLTVETKHRYCSDACKKLGSRKLSSAKPNEATRALIAQVAGSTTREEVAA